LTADGPARIDNDVTVVGAGHVSDIDLAGLPEGTHALEVTSDEPVVAAVEVEQRTTEDGASDMAWVPATAPVARLAGAVLPRAGIEEPKIETGARLSLASSEG